MKNTVRFWLAGASICWLGIAAAPAVAGTISGRVFEDVNYGGGRGAAYATTGGFALLQGVRVEIYTSAGTYVSSVTTNASGAYSYTFGGNNNNFIVRVVSATVPSSRGSGTGLVPVATYRAIFTGNTPATRADDLAYVGGQAPATADGGANTTSATLTSAGAQVYTAIADADNNETFTTVDFGFSFDVVTNTNATGQGSLRQFVLNANALSNNAIDQRQFNNNGTLTGTDFPAGQETSIFMIPDGTARAGQRAGLASQLTNAGGTAVTGGTASRALISLPNGLDALTDAGTALDGTTQTTLFNSNTALLGTGGTVGVAATALSQLAGPEVELSIGTGGGVSGVLLSADDCVVRGLALHGSGGNPGDATLQAPTAATTGLTIEGCAVGCTAFSTATPATNPTGGVGIYLLNTAGTVRNNLVLNCGGSGLNYSGGFGVAGSGYLITGNEMQLNGRITAGGDNITVGRAEGFASAAGPVTITNNLIAYANSSGIQLEIGAISDNVIAGNTIMNNGKQGAATRLEGSGIHYLLRTNPATNPVLSTNSDVISRNIIAVNQSSAVVINYGQRNVRVSQNSIYGNGDGSTGGQGLIAVDFTPSTYFVGGNNAYGQGDGVTPNDGTTNANKPNGGMNYAIITKKGVTTSGTNTILHVEGFVGRRTTQTEFANTEIEFYRGDNSTDTNQNGEIIAGDGQSFPHGEPRTYIGTITTGSTGAFAADITVPTASISPALQTADPINSLAYKAGLGTSEAGINLIPNTIPPGALPVQLVSFEAQPAGGSVQLSWATASELNSAYFEVQRSTDGQQFEALAQVPAQGTASTRSTYAYADAPGPGAAAYYYRLRQVDADGSSAFSPVRAVRLAAGPAPQPYPNPTANYTALDLSALPATPYELVVTNLLGKVVATQRVAGGQVATLDLRALAAGSYLVRLPGSPTPLAWRVARSY